MKFSAFGVLVLSSFMFIALVSVASIAAWVLSAAGEYLTWSIPQPTLLRNRAHLECPGVDVAHY